MLNLQRERLIKKRRGKIIFRLNERWKKIKEYPNYAISDWGRVKRIAKDNNGQDRNAKIGKILKSAIVTGGYKQIGLFADGERKGFLIHKLVAHYFIGSCPKEKELNHKDADKENNYYGNLEYITHSENMKHAAKNGLMRWGELHPNTQLVKKQVLKIRRLYNTGNYKQKELARKFNVSCYVIYKIVRNKTWKHL